jgi:hypothetical protein
MKTSKRKFMRLSSLIRIGTFGVVATALSVVLSTGCDNTAEGDPCDIALSHDECANGPTAQCIVPAGCTTGNAYCCSPNSTASNCQPCTTPDAGDDGGDDSSSDGGGAAETAVPEATMPEAAMPEATIEASPSEAGPDSAGDSPTSD